MNTEQKIPDEIKKQIEDELDNYLERLRISSSSIDKMRDVNRSLGFKTGAEFGYQLGIAGRSAGLEREKELEEVKEEKVKLLEMVISDIRDTGKVTKSTLSIIESEIQNSKQ